MYVNSHILYFYKLHYVINVINYVCNKCYFVLFFWDKDIEIKLEQLAWPKLSLPVYN